MLRASPAGNYSTTHGGQHVIWASEEHSGCVSTEAQERRLQAETRFTSKLRSRAPRHSGPSARMQMARSARQPPRLAGPRSSPLV